MMCIGLAVGDVAVCSMSANARRSLRTGQKYRFVRSRHAMAAAPQVKDLAAQLLVLNVIIMGEVVTPNTAPSINSLVVMVQESRSYGTRLIERCVASGIMRPYRLTIKDAGT
jgi:hypothetical protein